MHAHEVDLSEALVRSLIDDQFPEYRGLELAIVEPWGTDNAIWRLGPELVVRMPRIKGAVGQIGFEATWLPRLAPHLSVALPEPVAVGEPGHGYPFPWAVHRWLIGQGATLDRMAGPVDFAHHLAEVVKQLRVVPTAGAPVAKNRARPIQDYDSDTRAVVESARHLIDVGAALEVWDRALAAPAHIGEPIWVHGDLEGNCLVNDGQLSGLVDWGLACAGDPAIDIQAAWSPLFNDESRDVFLLALDVDEATIARAKGAAINQACGALPYYLDTYPLIVERSWHKLAALGVGAAPDQVGDAR